MLRTEFETYGYTEVEVTVNFSAGHRIIGHTGKCRHLHGHSYTAVVKVSVSKLDKLDMVVDFGDLKKWLKEWIDEHWDHNMILHKDDVMMKFIGAGRCVQVNDERVAVEQIFGGKTPYTMTCGNPTAENMAQELYLLVHNEYITKIYDSGKGRSIWVKEVAIKEEEGCWARYVR